MAAKWVVGRAVLSAAHLVVLTAVRKDQLSVEQTVVVKAYTRVGATAEQMEQ